MIKKRYFLPLLAALALSSCSSEDNVINDEPENKNFGYVAVNIVQANNVGSRAASEGLRMALPTRIMPKKVYFSFLTQGLTPLL